MQLKLLRTGSCDPKALRRTTVLREGRVKVAMAAFKSHVEHNTRWEVVHKAREGQGIQ
jgi:hypothetical protein